RAELGPELQHDINIIKTSADYLQRLSNGLRMLALDPDRTRGDQATEIVNWWRDAAPILNNIVPRGITLTAEFPEDECEVAISRPALTQAIFNLVQNSADAMVDRGSGEISIQVKIEEEAVRIKVIDNGPGMDEEVRRRCVDAFFTTKTRALSTGLGLPLVFSLI